MGLLIWYTLIGLLCGVFGYEKALVQISSNMHIFGGQEIKGVTNIEDCYSICIEKNSCKGFDFEENSPIKKCYIHTDKSICQQLYERQGVTNYRFKMCGSEDFTQNVIESFKEMHIFGGHEYNESSTLIGCLSSCQQMEPCVGMDFNMDSSQCFIHSEATGCGIPSEKKSCVHYRLKKCQGNEKNRSKVKDQRGSRTSHSTPNSSNTPSVTSQLRLLGILSTPRPQSVYLKQNKEDFRITTASVKIDSSINSPKKSLEQTKEKQEDSKTTTGTDTEEMDGYVHSQDGVHVSGGVMAISNITKSQCLDYCRQERLCLAVDYNYAERSCWFHNYTSACKDTTPKPYCTHYMKIPCTSESTSIKEVVNGVHIHGGQELCRRCSLEQCIKFCGYDSNCAGVDYDNSSTRCFGHDFSTVCNDLEPKVTCSHYRKLHCAVPQIAAFSDTPSPDTNPSGFQSKGVTEKPYGWAVYPGMSVSGGRFVAKEITGDICFQLCESDKSCKGVDFNVANGGCWTHDGTTKCNRLVNSALVYHAKRGPICFLENETGLPYPAPVATVP